MTVVTHHDYDPAPGGLLDLEKDLRDEAFDDYPETCPEPPGVAFTRYLKFLVFAVAGTALVSGASYYGYFIEILGLVVVSAAVYGQWRFFKAIFGRHDDDA